MPQVECVEETGSYHRYHLAVEVVSDTFFWSNYFLLDPAMVPTLPYRPSLSVVFNFIDGSFFV